MSALQFTYYDFGNMLEGTKVLVSNSVPVLACCGICCTELETFPSPVMLVHQGLVKTLTIAEMDAMLYHEMGHIVNGDIYADNGSGIVLKQDLELAADAYAASRVGAEVVAYALSNIHKFFRTSEVREQIRAGYVEKGSKFPGFWTWIAAANFEVAVKKAVKPRIAALKAM